MSPEEAVALVARVSYLPGARVDFTDPYQEGVWRLGLATRVPDVRNPDELIWVGQIHRYTLEELAATTDRELLLTLATMAETLAVHESREWLRLDGEPLNEPHPP